MRVLVSEEADGHFSISCCRLSGDTFAYHALFRKLKAALGEARRKLVPPLLPAPHPSPPAEQPPPTPLPRPFAPSRSWRPLLTHQTPPHTRLGSRRQPLSLTRLSSSSPSGQALTQHSLTQRAFVTPPSGRGALPLARGPLALTAASS